MAEEKTAAEDWWDDRLAALESVLGPSDGMVTHSGVPSGAGYAAGGPDIVHFRSHVAGVVHATCEMIGLDAQIPNRLGNYELAICHRDEEDWGVRLIASLAHYTFDERLEPGHTMDLGDAAPAGATISALLFLAFARFVVRRRKAGVLLCIGITAGELAACRNGGARRVEKALRAAGVYPFTDLRRPSVIVN